MIHLYDWSGFSCSFITWLTTRLYLKCKAFTAGENIFMVKQTGLRSVMVPLDWEPTTEQSVSVLLSRSVCCSYGELGECLSLSCWLLPWKWESFVILNICLFESVVPFSSFSCVLMRYKYVYNQINKVHLKTFGVFHTLNI